MKGFVKGLLGAERYGFLVRQKRWFKRELDKFLTVCVNMAPSRWRAYMRSRISVVRKMDYPKCDILLDISSPMEYDVRVHSCAKEPETVDWIEGFFKPQDVIFDVGANVGAYALIAASRMKGSGHVYAFEPSFLNFPQLCRNIALNGYQDTVTAFNVALSGKTGLDVFNYHSFTVGGSLHTLGAAIDYKKEAFAPVFKQAVLAYTMDDFIAQFNIPLPQHLKLDVDGTEHAILRGAAKTLADAGLKSVLIEMAEDEKDLMDHILSKGFKVHKRFPQDVPALKMFNYIFVRA